MAASQNYEQNSWECVSFVVDKKLEKKLSNPVAIVVSGGPAEGGGGSSS
jgi:hypothetical protein